MIKIVTSTGVARVSPNIIEQWKFIVSNNYTYRFYLNYTEITTDDFLKLFLKKTKNWKEYHMLYLKLKPSITLKQYYERINN